MPNWNDENIQLRDLRILQIILNEGSLTRAATLLDTTQPTISKALTRLRSHFNDPLLVRDGQRMRLTSRPAACRSRFASGCAVPTTCVTMAPTNSIRHRPIANSTCC